MGNSDIWDRGKTWKRSGRHLGTPRIEFNGRVVPTPYPSVETQSESKLDAFTGMLCISDRDGMYQSHIQDRQPYPRYLSRQGHKYLPQAGLITPIQTGSKKQM